MSQNINGQNLMAEQTELLRKQARLIKIQTAIFSAFMFIIAVVLLILCTKLNGIISEANSAISQISGLTEQLSTVLEESNLTELLTNANNLIEEGGKVSHYLDENIPSQTLSDRKDVMVNECDIVVALPGGVGTLDEIFSTAASHSIGYHKKRVVLYNMKGFWNSLVVLMDDLAQKGMIRGSWRDMIEVADNLEELIQKIGE